MQGSTSTVPSRPILIVDDDIDLRETLAEVLRACGYAVVTAANGRVALELLRAAGAERKPAVILLDLMMPIMDGYEFLEERRRDTVVSSIPVAIITAGHGVDRSRLGEGTPVVMKPFKLSQILESIQQLVADDHATGKGGAK